MSQFALKLIALVSMLLDHTAKVVLKTGTLAPYIGITAERQLRTWMLILGRMAFPMFAWFAAEGCHRSSDPKKHLLRLGIFSLLSEIPFQLCFYDKLALGAHNVIFTFLLASAAIYASERLEDLGAAVWPVRILTAALAVALGWFLYTDYNAWGVGLVIVLYYLPERKHRLLFLLAWVTVFQLFWKGRGGLLFQPSGRYLFLYWLGELTAVALLAAYNGTRGRRSKWLFYCFYPLHLALLYLISL